MKKFSLTVLLCLLCFQIHTSAQTKKFKLKFSVSAHSGAYLDITGRFKNGYSFGGVLGLRTSGHIEVIAEFNKNFAREVYKKTIFNFNDYSLGLRIYLGNPYGTIKPVIETALGIYPNFRDFGEYKGIRGGFNVGAGALIKLTNNIDILAKSKIHLAVVTGGHPGGGFYVYSGIYAGLKYTF